LPVTGQEIMGTAKPFVAVVDDDASVGRAIKRLLRSVGIVADTFASGDEFLDTLWSMPSYRPACVILDVQMPGSNGLEVQHRLAGEGLPVVFITAHDDLGLREQALSAGAVAYLRKPFTDQLLIRTVCAALGIDVPH
jgi:FixJ family two-component response regulator